MQSARHDKMSVGRPGGRAGPSRWGGVPSFAYLVGSVAFVASVASRSRYAGSAVARDPAASRSNEDPAECRAA